MIKSSLKVPKYNVCTVLMRQQLYESRSVTTMSMDMCIHSDEESEGDHSVFDVTCSSKVGAFIETNQKNFDDDAAQDGKYSDRDNEDEIQSYEAEGNIDSELVIGKYDEKEDIIGLREEKIEESPMVPAPVQGADRQSFAAMLDTVNNVHQEKEVIIKVSDSKDNQGGSRKHEGSVIRPKSRCSGQNKINSLSKRNLERRHSLQPAELFPTRKEFQSPELGPLGNNNRRRQRSKERREGRPLHSKSCTRDSSKDRGGTFQSKELMCMDAHDDELSTLSFTKKTIRVETLPNSIAVPRPVSPKQNKHYDMEAVVALGYENANAHSPSFQGGDTDPVSTLSCTYKVKFNRDNQDQVDPKDDCQDPGEISSLVINPSEYDAKGRCVRHPLVRLRKKKLFGSGWMVLMSACPDCCISEVRRMEAVMQKLKAQRLQQRDMGARHEKRGYPTCLPVAQEPTQRNNPEDSSQEILPNKEGHLPKCIASLATSSHSLDSGLLQTGGRLIGEWKTTSNPLLRWRPFEENKAKKKNRSKHKDPRQHLRTPPIGERKGAPDPITGERSHKDQKEKKEKKNYRSKSKTTRQDRLAVGRRSYKELNDNTISRSKDPQQYQPSSVQQGAMNDRYGKTNCQVNNSSAPHGQDILVYCRDSFPQEGEWKHGGYSARNIEGNVGQCGSRSHTGSYATK